MAEFYGRICGNRGEATRMGSHASGFVASAQSYVGSVIVYLSDWPDWRERKPKKQDFHKAWKDRDGKKHPKELFDDKDTRIQVASGSSGWGGKTVYSGSMLDLLECDELVPFKNGRRMTRRS